ncbi:SURP and G-patch domain-containing protein 1 [Halocaridina rubra]|uniref:SURP and G-patch domain-containing protein 1 n=1 Tax=Halocaridina rubra TaxID=373956 RepID=A0AAN8XCP3_HALRR
MSNNYTRYPAEDRVKEMSKQEEILMKRKREIERRLQEAGGGKSKSGSHQVSRKTPKAVAHSISPQKTSSDESSSFPKSFPMMNKFSNDGSFFEQFKKMTGKQSEVKEEKNVYCDKVKINPKTPKAPVTKDRHPAFLAEGEVESLLEIKEEVKMEPKMEMSRVVKEEIDSNNALGEYADPSQLADHPDWFKEALKRAKDKAKQLSGTDSLSSVSLSAGTSEDGGSSEESLSKKRKSRWSETPALESVPAPPVTTPVVNLNVPPNLLGMVGEGEHIDAIRGVMVTRITRNSPSIYAYAQKVFGSIDLTEAQWKQCEEQMKMNVVFQLLQAKQKETERLQQQGKVKYEYDSDEDTEGGTWEHKRRAKEMADTHMKAQELTTNAEGKHHIGDFLPPDELAKFMEKYRALKEGRDPDLSDYQEHKLTEDNIGYRMLKSMGWTEGMGLGAEGKGITTPVNQSGRSENQGLGVERPDSLTDADDEYDAYRKRMMLAYRFRPNPLNNPRRAYY